LTVTLNRNGYYRAIEQGCQGTRQNQNLTEKNYKIPIIWIIFGEVTILNALK